MATAPVHCNGCEENESIESFCANCEQLYCRECTRFHVKSKATRGHYLLEASLDSNFNSESFVTVNCSNDCNKIAVCLCFDCRQLLCETCTKPHSTVKATKQHFVIPAREMNKEETESVISDSQTQIHKLMSACSLAQVSVEKGKYIGTYSNDLMSSAPADKEVTRVRGLAILTDGRIVVADYKNKSLKLFNAKLQFIISKNLKEDPRGMVGTSNDLVAVTIADKKEIRLYRLENAKIKRSITHKMREKPFSIAFNKERFVVEHGEGEDGTIRIYDTSFKELYIIPGHQRAFGQFTGNTIRLAMDFAREKVFVVDIAREKVHCVNFKGQMIWTVKVLSPRGIIIHEDTLFVSSSEPNMVLQMNALDGYVYQLIDEQHRVKRPRYIAYQSKLKQLAVDIDGNHIKFYSITQ